MKQRAQRKRRTGSAGEGAASRDASALPQIAALDKDGQTKQRILALAKYTVSELQALGFAKEEQLEMWRYYLEDQKEVAPAGPRVQAGQTQET